MLDSALSSARLPRWFVRCNGLAQAHLLAVGQLRAVDARLRDLVRRPMSIDDLRRVAPLLGERNVGACPRDDVGGIDGSVGGGDVGGGGGAGGRAGAARSAA